MNRKRPASEASDSSAWTTTAELPTFAPLDKNIETDVCIVGAGISGLTTGFLLAENGKQVVILDDGHIASGMTQVTTAHLSNIIDDRLINIERWHGDKGLRLAVQSHAAAIDCIESISAKLRMDCDFKRVDGYLFRAPDDGEKADLLDRELQAANRAGIVDAEIVTKAPIPDFDTGAAIRFPHQARFHPLKYLARCLWQFKNAEGKSSRIAMSIAWKVDSQHESE